MHSVFWISFLECQLSAIHSDMAKNVRDLALASFRSGIVHPPWSRAWSRRPGGSYDAPFEGGTHAGEKRALALPFGLSLNACEHDPEVSEALMRVKESTCAEAKALSTPGAPTQGQQSLSHLTRSLARGPTLPKARGRARTKPRARVKASTKLVSHSAIGTDVGPACCRAHVPARRSVQWGPPGWQSVTPTVLGWVMGAMHPSVACVQSMHAECSTGNGGAVIWMGWTSQGCCMHLSLGGSHVRA